jgi:3-hydroxyacyl-CoA dehydrogenase
MALGGGAEIVMAASRVVAHVESYIGQVEAGMGLIPSGGGVKELLRRGLAPMKTTPQANPQPFVSRVFQTVSQAKVSTSAFEAQAMGFLAESDRIVFNRDHLLGEAKREVLEMARAGYRAPIESRSVYAVGRDGLAALKIVINGMRNGNYISDYDVTVGKQLANVVAGGDLSTGQWVSEQYILDLEREAFVNLARQPKTMERIWSFLQTGKALRN